MDVSKRLTELQKLVEPKVDTEEFLFGKIFGQLAIAIEDAKKLEEAVKELSVRRE